jgi:hypothetical protein
MKKKIVRGLKIEIIGSIHLDYFDLFRKKSTLKYTKFIKTKKIMSQEKACPVKKQYPVMGDESLMSEKKHGTTDKPVMKNLRWNVDWEKADR